LGFIQLTKAQKSIRLMHFARIREGKTCSIL
jgi:hypothetical protein